MPNTYVNIYIYIFYLLWTKYTAVRLGGSKSAAVMKMKIYTYIYMYRWLPHNAIQGCILSVYEYNRLPRPDLRWDLFIYCVVRLFSHFRSCTTFNKVVQQWTDSSWYSQYIYIGREVQRWTRKGMYQKQCSWMDYFCALVLISEAKVVYMYISFWHCLCIVFIAIYVFINFDLV